MGKLADWWNGPAYELNAPQVRSVDPYVADNGTVHDGSDVNDIPTRGDWKNKITSGEALTLAPVYRATQIITTAVMQCSLDAFKNDLAIEKPLILRKPNPDDTLPAFLEQTALALVLEGNAFWRVYRDNQGRVTGIRVLNPKDVQIKTDPEGIVTGYDYMGKTYPKTDIKHLSHMRVHGKPEGKGPIQAAQGELRAALDARNYQANWFQDSVVPLGILKTEQVLNPIQAQQYREQWNESQGGARGTAVLGHGLTFTPVYLTPEQAQWLSVQQHHTTAIARLFGIPAGLMIAPVEGTSDTYQNQQQAWVEFQRFTLVRYTVEIEQALSDLLPRGTEVKFNLSSLLRPDDTTRWAIHTQAHAMGVHSINEIRAIEGEAPIPDGDHKTAAQKVAEAQAFAAPAADEDAPEDEEAPNE